MIPTLDQGNQGNQWFWSFSFVYYMRFDINIKYILKRRFFTDLFFVIVYLFVLQRIQLKIAI